MAARGKDYAIRVDLDDMMHGTGLASEATRKPLTYHAAVGAPSLAIMTVSLLVLCDRRPVLLARLAEA